MLEVCKNQEQSIDIEKSKEKDIIVRKWETKIIYDEKGNKIEKRVPQYINITRMINETQKLLKRQNAEQKLAKFEEIQKIFTRK